MAGTVTTTLRDCTIGCTNSTTTECCTTDLCNIKTTVPPVTGFQCYGCTTTSNSSTDPCLAGIVSSPIMSAYTCPAQAIDCFMESTSKNTKFNQRFIN